MIIKKFQGKSENEAVETAKKELGNNVVIMNVRSVKRKGLDIKYVVTDLSAAFISSVYEHCPYAVHVFDHFHVVKLMNEKLDYIRRVQ